MSGSSEDKDSPPPIIEEEESENVENHEEENSRKNTVEQPMSSPRTTPLLAITWPWSSPRTSKDEAESVQPNDRLNEFGGGQVPSETDASTRPGTGIAGMLGISWPWSQRPSQEDLEPGPISAEPVDIPTIAPTLSPESPSGHDAHAPPSQKKSILGISWPWSRGPSQEELKPPVPFSDEPAAMPATTSIPFRESPGHETSVPPSHKKSFLGIAWPWSSEKRQTEESNIDKPSEAHDKASKKSKRLLSVHWPWSSNQENTNESQDLHLVPDSKPSKFSEQIAEFARKALPEKLLAITPWGNKHAEDDPDVSVLHGPGKQLNKDEDMKLPYIPLHKGLPGITTHKKDSLKPKGHTRGKSKNRVHDSSSSRLSLSHRQDSEAYIDDLQLLNVAIPDHLAANIRATKSPETTWATTFYHLATLASEDERYDPINVQVFSDKVDHSDLNSESSEGSRVPSTMSFAPYVPDEKRSTPFMYNHRPFRMPKLAILRQSVDSGGSTPNIFKFDPIQVGSSEWFNIQPGSETYLAATKWTLPEPIRADKRLLPEIDPLVKYKLRRLGKTRVTPAELQKTQREIAVGISPSGRKLDGYSSGSEEECVYRRVLCKNDPDFDVVQPFVETQSGEKWPNPFLLYWNWKKTDENPNESYLHHQRLDKDNDLASKRRIALELESHPLKIPYQNLGADDTDYEDPLGPISTTPVSILDKFSIWKPSQSRVHVGGGDMLEDPITRRYPYLLLDQYSKYYRRFYQLQLLSQAQRRKFYEVYMRILGKQTSLCATVNSYPLWFYVWKKTIRYFIRRLPRKWKFSNEKKCQTVFYGTLASLYATQYIAEYDLLPNMDDPVYLSQLALEKALEIKGHYLTYDQAGRPFVDYIKMQRSKMYEKYMEWIGLLCRFQPIKMPPRVRKVFFINYFNVLSIQTQILRIPEKENTKYLWEMEDFWGKTKGLAGYMEFSLEEIYHGILRCNRIHPIKQTRVFEDHPVKGFPKEMSPSRLSLNWVDPRIHFTLSVGCKYHLTPSPSDHHQSCPPIYSFSLYEQEFQLDEVARTYVQSRIQINIDQRTITLPILLLWYERDFGNNKFVMLWYLKQFMTSKDTLKVRQLLGTADPIYFRYERFNDEIDHTVRRHSVSISEPSQRKKIIPVYWGSKF